MTLPLVLPVDDEQLVIDHLRRQADVAALIGDRIGISLPAARTVPRVRVQRLGGTSPAPYRLDKPRLQIECLADSEAAAKDLCSTVRAALYSIPGVHPLGTVTSIDEIAGPQRLPDPTGGPGATPAPRLIFSIQLVIHPN